MVKGQDIATGFADFFSVEHLDHKHFMFPSFEVDIGLGIGAVVEAVLIAIAIWY
ncbi:MAG TPA: hypothetical protein VE197_05100 [Mycobacterium sp.]|nr:hypothetical protein [Mycobacterium sp.]